ncbi:MAG: hypothetical protein PHC61_03885 [Chitinivibrionales bacterium]|nr:hypothetical protein [Chitinivibrionales bacterium]
MKKFIALFLVASILFIGCASTRSIGGVEYKPYGLINEAKEQSPKVKYSTSWGNVILGTVFLWTIATPIYCFGYALFEPEAEQTGSLGK